MQISASGKWFAGFIISVIAFCTIFVTLRVNSGVFDHDSISSKQIAMLFKFESKFEKAHAETNTLLTILAKGQNETKISLAEFKEFQTRTLEFQTRTQRTAAAAEATAVALTTHEGEGCGTLVSIRGRSFIATAAHVILNRKSETAEECMIPHVKIQFLNQTIINMDLDLDSVLLHSTIPPLDIALIPLCGMCDVGGVPIGSLQSSEELLGVAAYRGRNGVIQPFQINARKRFNLETGEIASDMQGAPGFSGSGLLQSGMLVAIHSASRASPFETNLVSRDGIPNNRARRPRLETPGIDYDSYENAVKELCFETKTPDVQCLRAAVELSQLHARNPSTQAVLADQLLPGPIPGAGFGERMQPARHRIHCKCADPQESLKPKVDADFDVGLKL